MQNPNDVNKGKNNNIILSPIKDRLDEIFKKNW